MLTARYVMFTHTYGSRGHLSPRHNKHWAIYYTIIERRRKIMDAIDWKNILHFEKNLYQKARTPSLPRLSDCEGILFCTYPAINFTQIKMPITPGMPNIPAINA